MTADEIWKLATAGDDSLDLALAKELDLPLEEFQAEKNRRKAQAAAARAKQQELNETRSTGSSRSDEDRQADDTSALIQAAKDYLDSMEEAASKDRAREQLQGQTTFPGFEEPEEPDDPASDAEAIKLKAYRAGFQMDFLRSPDDALLDWSLSGSLPGYLSKHFAHLVQKVADELGADPAQVADKDLRTPEQERKLMELAAQEQAARIIAFFDSMYMQALASLAEVKGTLARQIEELDTATPEAGPGSLSYIAYRVKEQAVLYFFALHDDLNPTKPGALSEDQKQELQGIYSRLDDFYARKIAEGAELKEFDYIYSALFSAFIELENPEVAEAVEESLPRIISRQAGLLSFPLDKPNSRIWNLLDVPQDGRLTLEIDTTSQLDRRKGKEAIINYTIDFNELDGVRFTKQLTPFDKRVYMAADALHNAGNRIMTASQIHRMMGNRVPPSTVQIERINESLDKMRATIVHIDSSKEAKVNKGYTKFVYDGALIEFRRVSAYIDNTRTDSAIMLLAEPPLITFAKKRNQITGVPRLLLESPVNKTDANLMLDDYLIERISHMKNNPKLPRKMLYSKIFERCQIKTRMQRKRAPEKIRKYLDHYKECDFIRGYKEDPDGITVQF